MFFGLVMATVLLRKMNKMWCHIQNEANFSNDYGKFSVIFQHSHKEFFKKKKARKFTVNFSKRLFSKWNTGGAGFKSHLGQFFFVIIVH